MDEEEGTRAIPPLTPSTSLNPFPNPEGGIIVPVTTGDFPIIIAIDHNIPAALSPSDKPGDNFLNVNSDQFPVEIRFKGSVQTRIETIVNVSRAKFPLTIKIGEGSSPAVTEESPQGLLLIVSREKFPVQINLTP